MCLGRQQGPFHRGFRGPDGGSEEKPATASSPNVVCVPRNRRGVLGSSPTGSGIVRASVVKGCSHRDAATHTTPKSPRKINTARCIS